MSEGMRIELLESALSIGRRLCKSALWDRDECSWVVTTIDPAASWSKKVKQEVAGPGLYQGTAGIALFLLELGTRFQDEEVLRCAGGALKYALSRSDSIAPLSLFSGKVGLAFVAQRMAEQLSSVYWQESFRRILDELVNGRIVDRAYDVLGGSAGAIMGVASFLRSEPHSQLVPFAQRLGDHLLEHANLWPIGWSWPSVMAGAGRDLTGLAHGAAGCGAALIELYQMTGDHSYRFAAEQAFAYESRCFDDELGNWRDYRDFEVAEALATSEGFELLRLRLTNGTIKPGSTRAMTAWCHGAPGICLTRLHAFRVLRSDQYRADFERAARTTALFPSQNLGFSLCHGVFGNDSVLWEVASETGDSELAEQVVARAIAAVSTYEKAGVSWPSGALGSVPDPSLMLGDAGIGMHLLSLCGSGVPNMLLPVLTPPGESRPSASAGSISRTRTDERCTVLIRRYVDQHFGRSFATLAPDRAEEAFAALVTEMSTDSTLHLYEVAKRLLKTFGDELADSRTAAEIDLAQAELLESTEDFYDTLYSDLTRLPDSSVNWLRSRFVLSQFVRLISVSPTLHDSPVDESDALVHSGVVLVRTHAIVSIHRVQAFSHSIFTLLSTPKSLRELADEFFTMVPELSSRRSEIEPKLFAQVREAYRSQIVDALDLGVVEAS